MIRSALITILVVLVHTLALTLGVREVLDYTLELNLLDQFWYRDFNGNLMVSLVCLGLTQSLYRTLVLSTVVIIIFQAVNAGKLVVLGTPISPDDFINAKNLFILWEGVLRWGVIALAIIPLVILIALTRWKRITTWLTISLLIACVPVGALYSAELKSALDRRFGNSVWNQPENFKRRGLGLHIVQETVRTISKVGKIPSSDDVSTVNIDLAYKLPQSTGQKKQRNVHMIVLESFFDPNSLGMDWVPENPLPDSFLELWDSTDRSTIMSPVFGGYTANAEFESLCGFPVTENAVFFEGWLRRKVPCLPRVLASLGYKTIASHPNVAGFWNRTHAYNLVGFDTYWSKSDFDTSDSVGNFVLDHSYYSQVFDKLDTEADRPVFNYMLTIHGHLPYPRNERYPDVVNAGKESYLLQGYLNHIYYKSRDLMDMLPRLRADDPDALIIIFGDHLPNLGKNYAVYTDIKKMMPDRKDFTGDMFEFLSSTPMIIIDGKRGPIKTGKMPLYRLPAKIMSLLGYSDVGMFNWSKNPANKNIRPLYGIHVYTEDQNAVTCRPDTLDVEDCKLTDSWLSDIKTLSADIFTGHQFSLKGRHLNAIQ